MKKISVLVPTYNEEYNVTNVVKILVKILSSLKDYNYEIVILYNI